MAATLLFDGDCGLCSSSARLAARIAPELNVIAYQLADLPAYGVTADECRTAVQWVGAGPPVAGAPAVARVLLAGRAAWPLLGRLMLLPGVRWLAALVYRAVAANRYRLPGGTPACRSSLNR